MDVVTAYSYAHSFGGLTTPGFDHPILRAVEGGLPLMTATKFFPFLHALHHLPDWLGVALNPDIGGVAQLRAFLGAQVDALLRDPESLRSVEHETIYHHLMTPELVKKGEVPSRKALIEEVGFFISSLLKWFGTHGCRPWSCLLRARIRRAMR